MKAFVSESVVTVVTAEKSERATYADGVDNDRMEEAMAGGDIRALDELWARHGARAFSLAVALLGGDKAAACDVVEGAFSTLWKEASAHGGDAVSLPTRLYAITRRRALGALRQAPTADGPSVGVALSPVAEDTTVERTTRAGDEVRRAVDSLDTEQRHVIMMAYTRGDTCAEIAAATEMTTDAVKRHMRVGLKIVHDILVPAPDPSRYSS